MEAFRLSFKKNLILKAEIIKKITSERKFNLTPNNWKSFNNFWLSKNLIFLVLNSGKLLFESFKKVK